jgi:hypothetical protein
MSGSPRPDSSLSLFRCRLSSAATTPSTMGETAMTRANAIPIAIFAATSPTRVTLRLAVFPQVGSSRSEPVRARKDRRPARPERVWGSRSRGLSSRPPCSVNRSTEATISGPDRWRAGCIASSAVSILLGATGRRVIKTRPASEAIRRAEFAPERRRAIGDAARHSNPLGWRLRRGPNSASRSTHGLCHSTQHADRRQSGLEVAVRIQLPQDSLHQPDHEPDSGSDQTSGGSCRNAERERVRNDSCRVLPCSSCAP